MSSSGENVPIKAVFFDVDGVLLDSLKPHLQFCATEAKLLDPRITIPSANQFRELVASGYRASPMTEFMRVAGIPAQHIEELDKKYQLTFMKDYKPTAFPNVDQVLKNLNGAGLFLGLVTSNVRENVAPALGAAMDYFREDLVFFKDRHGDKKSDALTAAVKLLNVDPASCLFVGDMQTDADAAYDAGLRFLGMTCGWGILGNEGKFKCVDAIAGVTLDTIAETDRIFLPFNPIRGKLYSVKELWTGYNVDMSKNTSFDVKVFRYFKQESKYNPGLEELRAQRSHDGGIEYAVDAFLGTDNTSRPLAKNPVMILGSHSKYRSDPWFARVARLTYDLAKAGFFITTGGGPGLMEAANLGAYMAKKYTKFDLNDALELLRASMEPPLNDGRKQYEMPDYWEVAKRVVERFPDGGESLGVPTWFYGHEGANIFGSHIAKFFSNGLRESKMTSIGHYGSIFTPGGPGTSQEVFTDAAENAYHSFQWLSPMVFFNDEDDDLITKMMDVVTKQTSADYKSQDMLLRSTDAQRIIAFLMDRPPRFRERKD